MKTKQLVLLSNSLKNFFNTIYLETGNPILKEIIEIDDAIYFYNDIDDDRNCEIMLNSINNRLTDYARQLTMRMDKFEISFLPKGKNPIYTQNNNWSLTNRQVGKPIKILQKLLKKKFSNKDYETLNNILHSYILSDSIFKIVKGKDIIKYYNEINNEIGGTLSNSCMRYSGCSKFFDVYVDHCKMLILLNPKTDKILGRAILWNINEEIYMDRVYYSKDYILNSFINYAEDNNWWYRRSNGLLDTGETQYWKKSNLDDLIKKDLCVFVGDYEYFPYLDSFRYYLNGYLYDHPIEDSEFYSCDNVDGSITLIQKYQCDNCGYCEYVYDDESDNLMYSVHDDCYYCSNCGEWNCFVEDYVNKDDLREVFLNNNVCTYVPIWYLLNNKHYVEINQKWYKKQDE